MNKLRYAHDFVNMSKDKHRAILAELLKEFYAKKDNLKIQSKAPAYPSKQSLKEQEDLLSEG